MIVRGEVKLIVPYRTPLVMGNELVGTVEKLSPSAKGFKVGDRVYCRMPLSRIGAFAEYAAVECGALAKVPDYLTDEEAAAVPLTASSTRWASVNCRRSLAYSDKADTWCRCAECPTVNLPAAWVCRL